MRFECGKWEYEEKTSESVIKKQYPNYDGATSEAYVNADNRIAYLAYCDGNCVGQILLAKTWNNYVHIEDISVADKYRGRGIGTSLLQKAEEWTRGKGISALSLECQDNNILASRFYKKNGFEIGGVNTQLYTMLGKPYSDEIAVFWYKFLSC